MECKFTARLCNCCPRFELIDTLWNVNCSADDKNSHGNKELIDTLWNVNYFLYTFLRRGNVN